MIGGGAEDPDVVADDETDDEEDSDEEEDGECVVAGVEGEEVEEDAVVAGVCMRSAQGGLISWDLHRGFCSIVFRASVAADAREPP